MVANTAIVVTFVVDMNSSWYLTEEKEEDAEAATASRSVMISDKICRPEDEVGEEDKALTERSETQGEEMRGKSGDRSAEPPQYQDCGLVVVGCSYSFSATT